MVAAPSFTAVTLPVLSTVATKEFSDDHVIFMSVKSRGVMDAVRLILSPSVMLSVV
jgi:hypothetical protein